MQKITALLTLAFATLVLAGCNTIHGFGQDVQKVGEKIENSSKK